MKLCSSKIISGLLLSSLLISCASNSDKVSAKKAEDTAVASKGFYQGLGITSSGRVGPGKDSTGTSVYSLNEVVAYALFDNDGKIIDIEIDQLEVATPNYDGSSMPDFTGFPEQSYNADVNHDKNITVQTQTKESYLEEVSNWKTKRDRGASYRLKSDSWDNEMNTFEKYFVGKTVAEITNWFNTSADKNGRFDSISGATMSLKDGHGDIIGAIEKAYENRRAFEADNIVKIGVAVTNVGRIGPHPDATGKDTFTFNTQFIGCAYDAAGKVVAMTSDIMEVVSANSAGTSPRITGFPGQSYNFAGADGVSVVTQSEEDFLAQVAAWKTKRERGASYRLPSGTWAEEMDRFEAHFVGMTNAELEQFSASLDAKGKTDAVSGASISLRDAHADTMGAILNAWKNARDLFVK